MSAGFTSIAAFSNSSSAMPPMCSRSHGTEAKCTAWVVSWRAIQRRNRSRSTLSRRRAAVRFGPTKSRRGALARTDQRDVVLPDHPLRQVSEGETHLRARRGADDRPLQAPASPGTRCRSSRSAPAGVPRPGRTDAGMTRCSPSPTRPGRRARPRAPALSASAGCSRGPAARRDRTPPGAPPRCRSNEARCRRGRAPPAPPGSSRRSSGVTRSRHRPSHLVEHGEIGLGPSRGQVVAGGEIECGVLEAAFPEGPWAPASRAISWPAAASTERHLADTMPS